MVIGDVEAVDQTDPVSVRVKQQREFGSVNLV